MDSIGMVRRLGEQGLSCVVRGSIKPRWANPWNAEGDEEERAGQGSVLQGGYLYASGLEDGNGS